MAETISSQDTLGIVGAGHMGSAIIGGLIAKGYSPQKIWVLDHKKENCERIKTRWPINATLEVDNFAEQSQILILAVKPQTIKIVLQQIGPQLKKETLILSVAAGITTAQITHWLGGANPVVRAMPNLPALIGEGITGLYSATTTRPEQKHKAQLLMSAIGETLWLEDEALMDVVTALSGSGPGYLFYFLESLVSAGIQLGLTQEQAFKLVRSTAYGSCKMLKQDADLIALRQQVTSKGGTTEAAIHVLQEHNLQQTLLAALTKAKDRGIKLSQQMD